MVDLDIRGFYDNMGHEWTVKFVEHRVGDPRMLRLIQKWLKAGVSEGGQWSESKVGTPQGSVASPLLANIYLHYAFDLWVAAWRKKVARGDVIVVRYADDAVLGFEHKDEAERFLHEVRERLGVGSFRMWRSTCTPACNAVPERFSKRTPPCPLPRRTATVLTGYFGQRSRKQETAVSCGSMK